jgi:serine/threonine-protein kinase
VAEPGHSRVGGYRIIRKLAVGGMAEIYLARLEATHGFTKQVVLKRVLPQFCDDPRFIDMFLHEARLAAGLSHPNIAQVFDIGESDGRVYFTMEYVHGPDLRAIAKRIHARGGPPPLELVLGICIGVAAGLHYAHTACDESGRALEIVHRDVTPANVVVTYGGVAKLLDFGVAKAKLEDRESTAVGVLKGKLPYMSPEQIDCSVRLDGRSDVFSLGVMLWELTTLQRLFRSESQLQIIYRITQVDAPPPSSVCDDYPPALEAIVMRALARDRERRYASALELQRALEQFALEHKLAVSSSRIAELMRELFAEELERERDELEAESRETTDSEVFTTHWDPARDRGSIAHPQVATPGLTVVTPELTVAAPGIEPLTRAQPQRRRWVTIAATSAAAIAVVLVGALAWTTIGRDTDAAAPAQLATDPPTDPPTVLAQPAPAPAPEPVIEPSPAPVDVAVSPAAGDIQPPPPAKRTPSRKKVASKTKTADWNNNSLTLPD